MRTKLLITLCLLVPAIASVFAQKTATISIGGGMILPSNNTRDSAYLRSMQVINLQAYLPVVKRSNYSIGLQAGASYGWGNQKQITTLPAGYPALNSGQSTFSVLDNGNPKNRSYQLEAGIASSIAFGRRLNIMPGIVAGYLHLEQRGISASQAGIFSNYGGSYVYSFTQKEETTKGICFTPRLKLMYRPNNLGVWIESGYTYGPDIINESTRSASSISTVGGTRSSHTAQIRTKYKATNISLGITVGIGKHTCLICGGVHSGKCKDGYMDNNSDSKTIDLQNIPLNKYGRCPHCRHFFADNDEVYDHSCLRVMIDREFYSYSTWVRNNRSGEIGDLFDLPQVFTAMPSSVSIQSRLKNILGNRLVNATKIGSYIKTVYKLDSMYRTDILLSDPNPPILEHVMGVQISCEGNCTNNCTEQLPNGGWKCSGCTAPSEDKPLVCRKVIRGDFNHYREEIVPAFSLAIANQKEIYKEVEVKTLIQNNFPVGFLPVKSEMISSAGKKILLLQCSNGKRSAILISKIENNTMSYNCMIIQGNDIPAKIPSLKGYLHQTLKRRPFKHPPYISHIALLR